METYDLVIVGAGPGGYVAAIRAGQLGLRTALVERGERLGGTCLNVGCIPTKALLESSELYARLRGGLDRHGIILAKDAGLDLSALMGRKSEVVEVLTSGVATLMKRHKVEIFYGEGRAVSPSRVEVAGDGRTRTLETRNVLLAMGSVPIELGHLPVDGTHIVSSDHALAFDEVPESMVVVGGGAVGLELASVWSRLGAEVTVVEMLDHIVPFADKQMASMLKRSLKKQGLDLREKTKVTGARVASGRVEVTCVDKKEKTETLTCEKLLVAVGRRPNTAGQGLEQLGVDLDERGRVRVDEWLRTTAPNVYAIGDLTTGPMLAHKAEEEGVSVAEQVAEATDSAGTDSDTPSPAVDHSLIPNVVYTHPELAQVGLTEKEAKEKGLAPKAGRFYFKASGRARTMGDDDGLVKVVAEKSTGRLLGVHIVGPHASELIGEATVAMAAGMTAEQLGRLIHAHPTLSEAVKEAALATDRLAIHG